jgi:hypothetical protein
MKSNKLIAQAGILPTSVEETIASKHAFKQYTKSQGVQV